MRTKEILVESVAMQLKQGIGEMEDFYNEKIKFLELEKEHRKHQINQLQIEKIALQDTIKTLKKVNIELNNERKILLERLDKKMSMTSVTGRIAIWFCEDEMTDEERVELITQLLKQAIHEEEMEKYVKELIQIISDSFSFMDYYQKRTIKRELKKNFAFYNQLFSKAQLEDIQKILFVYHSEKMKEVIIHLLDELVESNSLYNYNDEDALNIFLYIVFYDKVEKYYKNERFQKYYNSDRNYYAKKVNNLYKIYLSNKNSITVQSLIDILHEKESCIDLFKIDQSQLLFNKIFKCKIEQYYNIDNKNNYIKPEDYIYRHPNYSNLRNYGYQITNRTDEQRWKALQNYLNEHSLQETVAELYKRIRLKLGRKEDQIRYANALEKWEFDLMRLKETYYENDFPWPEINKS